MAQLAATDELELIYLHLQSMRNFTGSRTSWSPASRTDTAPATAPAAEGTDDKGGKRGARNEAGAAAG
jgi:hypothetical protein